MSGKSGRLGAKVAVVTGAASGIGRAVAVLFAAEGATVAVLDRDAAGATSTVAEITAAGGAARTIVLDVTDSGAVDAAFADISAAFGRIDILVHCAGIVGAGSAGGSSDGDWRRNIAVNLDGAFHCCRAAIRQMERNGGGSIVTIGSISAIHPGPDRAGYAAAKAGVHGLTRSIAAEYAAKDIRCNAIAPGAVLTPLTEQRFSDATLREKVRGLIPLGRFAQPRDIAYPALFLASEESAYVTGQILIVDGGFTVS